VVLAYYFEPYGMAGWLAAQWTGRPLLLKHAGSDLDRLARVPGLGAAYREILVDAAAVVTRPSLFRRFAGMGVDPQRIETDPPYGMDLEIFNPAGPALDVDSVALSDGEGNPSPRLDPALPTVGVYGKIGISKGTFDLIDALGRVSEQGQPFQLLAMVGAPAGEMIRPYLQRAGIADRTTVLPFLPHWKVPSFIRRCTLVCFLERDFPVAIHGPMVPREVLACGTCLVLSDDIVERQLATRLADDVHYRRVDPRDHDGLARSLASLLKDPAQARRLGTAGRIAVGDLPSIDEFGSGWSELLARQARPDVTTVSPADRVRRALEVSSPTLLHSSVQLDPGLLREFLDCDPDPALPGSALGWIAHLAARLGSRLPVAVHPPLAEALRLEEERVRAGFLTAETPPPFAVVDQLAGSRLTTDSPSDLYPVRANSVWATEFGYDVTAVFPPGPWVEGLTSDLTTRLAEAPKRAMLVLFQLTPHLVDRQLEINTATAQLLEMCDGRRTVDELAIGLLGPDHVDSAAHTSVLATLAELHDLGVIVFGRLDAVWGWRQGLRSELDALPPLRRAR